MKKNRLKLIVQIMIPVVVCVMAQGSLAWANDYKFFIKNNLNMFTYSENANAVCSDISVALKVGDTALAKQTVPQLRASESTTFTLSAAACTNVLVKATCNFKDHNRKQVVKTKQIVVQCKGGELYLSPTPNNREWTSFDISYFEFRP